MIRETKHQIAIQKKDTRKKIIHKYLPANPKAGRALETATKGDSKKEELDDIKQHNEGKEKDEERNHQRSTCDTTSERATVIRTDKDPAVEPR